MIGNDADELDRIIRSGRSRYQGGHVGAAAGDHDGGALAA
jgi:hypothetical protein